MKCELHHFQQRKWLQRNCNPRWSWAVSRFILSSDTIRYDRNMKETSPQWHLDENMTNFRVPCTGIRHLDGAAPRHSSSQCLLEGLDFVCDNRLRSPCQSCLIFLRFCHRRTLIWPCKAAGEAELHQNPTSKSKCMSNPLTANLLKNSGQQSSDLRHILSGSRQCKNWAEVSLHEIFWGNCSCLHHGHPLLFSCRPSLCCPTGAWPHRFPKLQQGAEAINWHQQLSSWAEIWGRRILQLQLTLIFSTCPSNRMDLTASNASFQTLLTQWGLQWGHCSSGPFGGIRLASQPSFPLLEAIYLSHKPHPGNVTHQI